MTIPIKEGLYYVGVLNPNLRVFDIVMNTEYGTTYNSYLIKDKKTVLIETAHNTFFDEYLDNIRAITKVEDIDYIVLNHTEPDHSGALKRLLEIATNATILCSKAASLYLKKITNTDIKIEVVKDGDTILVGKNELKFINAPFLHWPDSIFTYVEGLKTVFTCDFLGTHYCEPRIFDNAVTYPSKYKTAMKAYYDAIFSPFKPYVLAGLNKLSMLDFDTVCVSHGPILTKGVYYEYVRDCYQEWSESKKNQQKLLPVLYCSAYGYTKRLAEEALKTILQNTDAESGLYDIRETDFAALCELINKSDGFMLGSPTINKDTVPLVWELLAHLDAINNQKKPVGVFGSYGWSGEAVGAIAARLKAIRINVIEDGFKAKFYPDDEELKDMKVYTKAFIKEVYKN